jgi:hypothetical protein
MSNVNITINYSAIAASCGSSLIEAKGFEAKRQAALESVNVGVLTLHKGKVVVGQNKKCATATAFYDALVSGGLGKGTAANYLTTFRKAVADGKPVTEWNPAQSKAKAAKEKAKGDAKAKGSKAFADLLRPAFNHEAGLSFKVLCNKVQSDFEDAKFDNLYDAFKDFFVSEGDVITE